MQGEYIEKRGCKKNSAAERALKKIIPHVANANIGLADVLIAEAKDLRDAQELATNMYKSCSPMRMSLSNDAPRQMYRDRVTLVKPQVHAGQLKLFLSELRFLTEFANDSHKKIKVNYAGAAPGIHLPYLANLFPHVYFYLYDPQEFCDEVFKIQNLYVVDKIGRRGVRFNQSRANTYSEQHNLFGNYVYIKPDKLLFISDIRSGNSEDPKCNFEKCCQSDMEAQMNWIRAMQPAASMVKFRLPYTPGNTGYLAPVDDNHIWFGVFAPRGSTELRLVSGQESEMRKYDNTKIEEQTYYFNNFTRVAQYGPYRPHPKKLALGMDNCWDCCAMREICYGYLCQKYNAGADAQLPDHIYSTILLTTNLIPNIVSIIADFYCTVTEDELYDFMIAVVRECKAGDKLHAAPHGDNPKCVPWADRAGPDGYCMEPLNPKMPMDRVGDEVRRLYECARCKK